MVESSSPVSQILLDLKNRLKPVLSRRFGLAVGLWGEAGIGKTWAAEQILRGLPCKSYRFHAALSLTELARMPRPELPNWAETTLRHIAAENNLHTPGGLEALVALLSGIAPVIVHLEDLHEAQAKEVEAYQALAHRVKRSKGVALLVTSRTPPPEPFETYSLGPLSESASAALLASNLGAILPKGAATWIYGRARGNPLFTLEYLRHLTRTGHLWSDGSHWHWREPPSDLMPLTIEALVERQILEASGNEVARRALEARVMLPLSIPERIWAEVADLYPAQLEEAQTLLERHNLVRSGEFVHPLFREVRLKTLRPERRQALARRALQVFQDDPMAVADFVRDAKLSNKESLELLRRSANSVKDSIQAARLLAQAVEYAEGEEQGKLALQTAQRLRGWDDVELLRMAKLAAELRPDDPEAQYLFTWTLANQKRWTDLKQAQANISEEMRQGLPWLIHHLHFLRTTREYAPAIELWQGQAELFSSSSPDICDDVAWSLYSLGKYQEAQSVALRGLAQAEVTPVQKFLLLNALGSCQSDLGQFAQAEQHYSEMVELGKTTDVPPRYVSAGLQNRAMVLMHQGRYPQALLDLEEALKIAGEVGGALPYASTQMLLGRVRTEMGEYSLAEEALLEARAILLNLQMPVRLIECDVDLGGLYSTWKTPHAKILSRKYATEALQAAGSTGETRFLAEALACLARIEIDDGNVEAGLDNAQKALQLAEATKIMEIRAPILLIWARALEALEHKSEALQGFRAAEELALTINQVVVAQLSGLEIDRLSGDLERARSRLAWFEERGLMNAVNTTRHHFPELAQSQMQTPKPGLTLPRLSLLGPVQWVQDGKTVPIRGQKRKELLALLAEAPIAGRSEVSTLDLLQTLYPSVTELEAEALLRQVVFQTRSSLGQGTIVTTASGYALGAVETDAELFLKTGNTALWRGVYRADLDSEGDEIVSEALLQALANQAQALLDTDPLEATRVGKILLETDPYNTKYLHLTLQALRANDNHKSLSRLYEQARERFLEVGERLPETWQAFLKPA